MAGRTQASRPRHSCPALYEPIRGDSKAGTMTLDLGWLWIPATLVASAAQVARNAMQRKLTAKIGTVGATQVRFLYGFPFALLFLLLVFTVSGEPMPQPDLSFAAFLALGAASQILATGMMLAAMRERSFSVVTALIKTEPVQIALFGAVVLGDRLGPLGLAAILIATAGVVAVSWTRRTEGEMAQSGLRPILLGLGAGALFALSAVGFRGAILALDSGSFLPRATTTLVCGLGLQTLILTIWLVAFDRPALLGSIREWRASLGAGFVGALASQFWFIGFALTAAANVRTLALVEVVMAQALSRFYMAHKASKREAAGICLILAGVALLIWTTA
jgi:drug/metabolite transporter (DMT)-like permease